MRTKMSRSNASPSQRAAIPVYPFFSLLVGLSFVLTERPLHVSEAIQFINGIVPIYIWGWFYILAAVLMLSGMLLGKLRLYQYGLGFLVTLLCIWSLVLGIAALQGQATWSGWVWPLVLARLAWARMIELEEER